MKTINPITESPKRAPKHLLEVPQYVLDARKYFEQGKPQKAPHITSKQFLSLINRSPGNPAYIKIKGIKRRNLDSIRAVAERGMGKLKVMLKSAIPKDQIVLNKLIELKIKELDIIYNYIKKHR